MDKVCVLLKFLRNEILGCRFIVLHKRPFNTDKNAICRVIYGTKKLARLAEFVTSYD